MAKKREIELPWDGSYSYNFVPATLERLAVDWAEEEWYRDAIAILVVNREFHPRSAQTWYYLGQFHLQDGNREEAIAALEKAVELQPGNQRFQQFLDEARSGGA